MKTIPPGLLDTVVERLKAEFQPDQIWLYGSHAWGNPHPDSDVDILVVLAESEETPTRRSQRAHRCLRGLRMPKDVLVETRQEIDRVKPLKTSLENDIFSRGRKALWLTQDALQYAQSIYNFVLNLLPKKAKP